jgi:hypothetical protein
MKQWSTRLFLFSLAFSLGIVFARMLTRPTITSTIGDTIESADDSVYEPEPAGVESANSVETSRETTADRRAEHFTDEKKIGRRGKNKIEIRCSDTGEGVFAEIKFYSRTEYGAWIQMQSFKFEKDTLTGCDPVIEDFNNDGLKDFTYQSNVAARGANQIRKLFIYDELSDELVYIKNSEEYPNLAYNKKLKCIDAFAVTGATTTEFLRIEGDELKEFASVDTGVERVVTVTDRAGLERVIRREKMNPHNFDEIYRRFTTYDPPR